MRHVALSIAVSAACAASVWPSVVAAQPADPAAAAPGVPGAPVVPPPVPDAQATELANKFNAAMKCDGRKDPLRHFCAVTRVGKDFIWTPGTATSYLGLSVTLPAGADLKKTLAAANKPVVLHIGATSAKLAPVTLADAERTAVQGSLIKFLNTEVKEPTPVPPALAQAFKTAVHDGRVPVKLASDNRGYAEISGPTPVRLYRADAPSGSVFVTVENGAEGQTISVFPTQYAVF